MNDDDRQGQAETPQNVVSLQAKLAANEAYGEAIAEAASAVEQCAQTLFGQAVEVAMSGPWKEWSDAQPIGAVLHIDGERLASTNDPVVLELLTLSSQALEAVERIRGTLA
jgi:hypothetical protein